MQRWRRALVVAVLGGVLGGGALADAFQPPALSAAQQANLKRNFALCLSKLKGPYTENFCLCRDGQKLGVQAPNGAIRIPCKDPFFCAAYRAPWAEALAKERMYIANIFSRDGYAWSTFPNHHDLVRGYILEKYFIDTHPTHKLALMKQYRGLSSAEDETPARHRLLRKIPRLRRVRSEPALPARLRAAAPLLRPGRHRPGPEGARHGGADRVAARRLQAAEGRDPQPGVGGPDPGARRLSRQASRGSLRDQVDELIREIQKLTVARRERARAAGRRRSPTRTSASQLQTLLPNAATTPVDAIAALGKMMATARGAIVAGRVATADARRLDRPRHHRRPGAPATRQRAARRRPGRDRQATPAGACARSPTPPTVPACSTPASTTAASAALRELAAKDDARPRRVRRRLREAERVVEWAQGNTELAFAEVMAPVDVPAAADSAGIRDDVLRGSPLILYAAGRAPARRLRRRRRASEAPTSSAATVDERRPCAQPRPRLSAACASARRITATRATRSSRSPRRPPTSTPPPAS